MKTTFNNFGSKDAFPYQPIRTKNLKDLTRRVERINARERTWAIRYTLVLILIIGSIAFADEIDAFMEPIINHVIVFVFITVVVSLWFVRRWYQRQ